MVAGKRLSPQDTTRIRAYLNDTVHPRTSGEIATIIGVSTRTIERLKLNFDLFNAPYPPVTVRLGRPPTLTEAQQAWVLEFFNERPYAHLADATAAIWERFDVNLSVKSVANLLYKNRWNRQGKSVKRGATTAQARDVARDVAGSSTQTQNETSDVARDVGGSSTQLRDEMPDVARDVAGTGSSTQPRNETPDVVPVLEGPQVQVQQEDSTQLRNETLDVAPVPEEPQMQQEDAWDFVPQPAASPSPELPSPPSPVMLPEISLPAFYLQSAVEPTSEHDRRVTPLLGVRQPCPTCGCSSREHRNS